LNTIVKHAARHLKNFSNSKNRKHLALIVGNHLKKPSLSLLRPAQIVRPHPDQALADELDSLSA
jgi:hypothetical protein